MQVLKTVPLNFLAVADDGPPNLLLLVFVFLLQICFERVSLVYVLCSDFTLFFSVSLFALGALMPSVVSKYFF